MAAMQPFDGYVAQYLGDGLLVYFGYPQAHEDAAQRAVRAGLAIVDAMAPLNTRLEPQYGVRVAVRLGLHTGMAVVGSVGSGARQEQLAMGDTPNIAARLQGLAAPNTVVLSAATARLLHGVFALEDLGVQQLKGVAEPMAVCRVLGPEEPTSDEAEPAPARLPFLVGREVKLGLLLRRWEQSKAGLGQVVLLSGEAGIGKTALVEVLRAHVAREGYTRIGFRGSPYHTHSALYPVIEHLRRVLRLDRQDSPETTLDKLERALQGSAPAAGRDRPIVGGSAGGATARGALCGPDPDAPAAAAADAGRPGGLAGREAERRPVLAVYEDVHWADPSTLELLGMLLEQAPTAPMLHVLTFRPDFVPPWSPRAHLTPLTLNRLDRPQVEALIRHLTGGKALPAEVVQHHCHQDRWRAPVCRGADQDAPGIRPPAGGRGPLCPHGAAGERADSRHAARFLDGPPGSSARGESGGPTRGGAGPGVFVCCAPGPGASGRGDLPGAAGAVGGGGVALSAGPAAARHLSVQARLDPGCGLCVVAQEYPPAGAPAGGPGVGGAVPRDGGHAARAGGTALHRGRAAQSRPFPTGSGPGSRPSSARPTRKRSSTSPQGLELLATLPETPARAQQELDLQLALGPALMATKGYAAPEVEQTYARARALCAQVGETPQLFPTLRGLCRFYLSRGALPTARELGEQLYRLAQRAADPTHRLEAHDALGSTLFYLGEYAAARTHLEQGIALIDPAAQRAQALRHDVAPGVRCLAMAANTLWCLGYPAQAVRRSQEALALAQALAHPHSLAVAQYWAAFLHYRRREAPAVQAQAEALLTLATAQGFPLYVGHGTFWRGWALAMQGQGEVGLAQMHQGLAAVLATGQTLARPFCLVLLAEAAGHAGQVEEGLRLLAEALTALEASGRGDLLAEAYRLQGELLLRQATPDAAQAEACFQQALAIARRQQAKSWELRAAMSLSRLWQQQGKRAEAHELLAPIYGWFTEGFDTADLQEAKALLDELV